MSLKLNSSGGGSVTLQEPVTASTLTLNLPAFSGTAATLASVTNNGVLYVNSSGQPTSGSALTFDGTNLGVGVGGVGTAPIDVASNGSAIGLMLRGRSADSIGTLQFQSNDGVTVRAQIQSRGDELRILSAGNVPITSYVNGSEQMRLDSSGNLLVGTTSTTIPTGAGSLIYLNSPGALYLGHANGAATGTFYSGFAYNGSVIGSISQNGTTAVLYNITSDQRLKENIQDAASASALIDSLQVRQYEWKSDGSHQRYGFIAQELVTVVPEAVHQPINPDDMMAVDYSKLVPMLVKEIQSLRQRLAAAGI